MADNHDNGAADVAQRILDAAKALVIHYGYDKTTMSDIAREAGVSRSVLYSQYANKETLFDALIDRATDEASTAIITRIEADPKAGSLFSLYRHGLMVVAGDPLLKALYGKNRRVLGDYIRRLAESQDGNTLKMFGVEMIEQYQRIGLIRADVKPELVAYFLLFMRSGLLSVGDVVPNLEAPPLEEVGDFTADLLERALTPDDGGDLEAGKRLIAQILTMAKQMRDQNNDEQHDS